MVAKWSISAVQKETGVPQRSQHDIIASESDRQIKSHTPGKKPAIDRDTIEKMKQCLQGQYNNRILDWRELARKNGLQNVSGRTVKRIMNNEGYRKCRACKKKWLSEPNRQWRLANCDEWRFIPDWQWKQWHFSDESHFHCNSRHTDWVIRTAGERDCSDCMQKKLKVGASQVHVWAMIAYDYKSDLVFYDMEELAPIDVVRRSKRNPLGRDLKKKGGNVTMEAYAKLILPHVQRRRDYVENNGGTFVFQEDRDGGHGLGSSDNIAVETKVRMNIDWVDNWSPQSPDLNPIENVWRILKSRVKKHKCKTAAALRTAILEEWKGIDQKEINALIIGKKGMHARVQECYERNGLQTRY